MRNTFLFFCKETMFCQIQIYFLVVPVHADAMESSTLWWLPMCKIHPLRTHTLLEITFLTKNVVLEYLKIISILEAKKDFFFFAPTEASLIDAKGQHPVLLVGPSFSWVSMRSWLGVFTSWKLHKEKGSNLFDQICYIKEIQKSEGNVKQKYSHHPLYHTTCLWHVTSCGAKGIWNSFFSLGLALFFDETILYKMHCPGAVFWVAFPHIHHKLLYCSLSLRICMSTWIHILVMSFLP